ncbi:uncharacterized protein LOC131229039 isoform X1 [Magnolia sinica]|uniref:uncharacterized protein LOC131229039 isoform X1 n=1 Tax=Magnolia sinica TaxID=86752 RepID=UPI00265A8CE4|nr:uncharacterized protein LOC131229039 isoform X1 [Magnolia sinica]
MVGVVCLPMLSAEFLTSPIVPTDSFQLVSTLIFPCFLVYRLKYVEQELAKKRGKSIDATDHIENDLQSAEDELYVIPEHLKGFNQLCLNLGLQALHPFDATRATSRPYRGFVFIYLFI